MQMLNQLIQSMTVLFLALAFIVTLFCCWRFEKLLIKLVSLEVLVNLFVCGVGFWALHIDFASLLDVCIALSLIMFLSTVAYCQFLMQRGSQND